MIGTRVDAHTSRGAKIFTVHGFPAVEAQVKRLVTLLSVTKLLACRLIRTMSTRRRGGEERSKEQKRGAAPTNIVKHSEKPQRRTRDKAFT